MWEVAKYMYMLGAFFYGYWHWERLHEYGVSCQQRIERSADRFEQAMAMTGFLGRDMDSLFDLTWKSMTWPARLITLMMEPRVISEGKAAFGQIEKVTNVADLERKYCSDLRRP